MDLTPPSIVVCKPFSTETARTSTPRVAEVAEPSFSSRKTPPPVRFSSRSRTRSHPRTIAVTLLLVTLCTQGTGCTLIGAGIGAAVPRYETVDAPAHLDQALHSAPPSHSDHAPPRLSLVDMFDSLELGDEIEVVRASDHRELKGNFKGIAGDELVLATDNGPATIKVTDIELGRPLWVRGVPVRGLFRVRRGSYSSTGALIGLPLDIIAIVVVVAILSQPSPLFGR